MISVARASRGLPLFRFRRVRSCFSAFPRDLQSDLAVGRSVIAAASEPPPSSSSLSSKEALARAGSHGRDSRSGTEPWPLGHPPETLWNGSLYGGTLYSDRQ